MKIIENNLCQPRSYADYEGCLIIALESGDDRNEIIKKFQKIPKYILEESCVLNKEKSVENILYFDRMQPFCD